MCRSQEGVPRKGNISPRKVPVLKGPRWAAGKKHYKGGVFLAGLVHQTIQGLLRGPHGKKGIRLKRLQNGGNQGSSTTSTRKGGRGHRKINLSIWGRQVLPGGEKYAKNLEEAFFSQMRKGQPARPPKETIRPWRRKKVGNPIVLVT